MKICHQAAAVATCLLLVAAVPAARAQTVDLELVLAVDASGSVDEKEYDLQLQGIAAGFRDPAVREAIRAGPLGAVAVNLMTWAEPREPKDDTGWYILRGDSGAEAFAQMVEGLPRTQGGATGLGEGIAAAVHLIEGNAIYGKRRVIDVSGDGEETPARENMVRLPQARLRSSSFGIVINGLAIENDATSLRYYYRNKMQTGTGSFVMGVRGYGDFAEAMRRKLLREIEYRPEMSGLPDNLSGRLDWNTTINVLLKTYR